MVRATFVMEQHLGHQTYCQNLQRFVEQGGSLVASWVPVTYSQPGGLWEQLPLPRGIRGTLRGRSQVLSGLRQHAGDVLFFNTQVPAALAGGAVRRRPYLIATDITPIQYDQLSHLYGHRPDRSGALKAYKHRLNVRLFQGAARLLPWSNWTRASLMRDYGVDGRRITVVPPGVDLRLWAPGPARPSGPLRILFVGGDFQRKGGETLLRAFRSLPRGLAELHVVTRTRLPQEDGVLLYHDMKPNAPALIALYQSADVFVLPTEAEAFGIAAAEACAAGLCAIVSPVGGITDIVADGVNGFQVPPADVQALRDRLQLLAERPELRAQYGRAARARAEELFDARRNAATVAACLDEVVARAGEVFHAAAS